MEVILNLIIGVACGLLINYLADVLPTQRKLGQPACTHCEKTYPLADYLMFRNCSGCGKPRSWRSFITPAAAALSAVALGMAESLKLGFWFSLLVLFFMGLVVIIDIEHRLILHVVSLSGMAIGVLAGWNAHEWSLSGLGYTLLGGLIGFGVMLIFYLVGVQYARYRARKMGLKDVDEEALGFGDVMLAGALGLMLGWPRLILGLVTGVLLAGVFSLILILGLALARKLDLGNLYIPYGPFLILGAVLYIFFL